jgi:heme-degrading monooxygenase HmoA
LRVGGWAFQRIRQGIDAARVRAQERRTARLLSDLPDSVLADIGFRRVDLYGRPVRRPHNAGEAASIDFPLAELVPMETGPTSIEPIDEATPATRKPLGDRQALQIARIWRGRTPRGRADDYEAYLYDAGIKPLIKTAMGVQLLREDRETQTEFVTISYWGDAEAMSAFTGREPTTIHHLERDAEFLIELPQRVQILRILASHGHTGGERI